MEGQVALTQEEARKLYSLLAARGSDNDPVLVRLLGRIESHLYATLTIEEIESLRAEQGGGRLPHPPR